MTQEEYNKLKQEAVQATNDYKNLVDKYGTGRGVWTDTINQAKKKAQDLNDALYSASVDNQRTYVEQKRQEVAQEQQTQKQEQATTQQQQAQRPTQEAEDRRRRAASPNVGSTVLTSPLGLPPEPQSTKKKTLLGG